MDMTGHCPHEPTAAGCLHKMIKPVTIPAWTEESHMAPPMLAKEILVTDGCWGWGGGEEAVFIYILFKI